MGKLGGKKDRKERMGKDERRDVDIVNINLVRNVAPVNIVAYFPFVARSRPPYHHGNLRQVLLDAGVALIRKVGPKSFTMREVARRAGVSHNAPYRHFRDKEELISAIVGQGFERLNDAMLGQAAPGKSGIERLELCGRAYVNFALRWPGHFTAMFDLDNRTPAGEIAFQTLVGFIVQCQNEKAFPEGNPSPIALIAWSVVHGVAKLAVSGHLSCTKEDALEFTSKATAAVIRGLKTS